MKKTRKTKAGRKMGRLFKHAHLTWGVIGALGAIVVLISLVVLRPAAADLLAEDVNASCAEPIRPEDIVGCVGIEKKRDLLQIYREKVQARIAEPGNGCGVSFIDIYEDFFENIEMQKFPELYMDFLDYALERQVDSSSAERVLKVADALYELTPSVEAARAGLKTSGYFQNPEYIEKYEALFDAELSKMDYAEYLDTAKMAGKACHFWFGPTTSQLTSTDDFRTRFSKILSSDAIVLYDDQARPWTAAGATASVSLFSECESLGQNRVYFDGARSGSSGELALSYAPGDDAGNSTATDAQSFYAGVKNAPHQTVLDLDTATFLESAKIVDTSATSKTYEKSYQLEFCSDAWGTDCEKKNLPLKITILDAPVYYGASAVKAGEKATTVGPTKALVEKSLSTIRIRTGVTTTLSFYHNFYASLPLEDVIYRVSKSFPYDTYHFSIAETKTTVAGVASDWEGSSFLDGSVNLLEPESIFYFNNKTSLRDYENYLVQDSYKIQFNSPGVYKFCEGVSTVENSGEVTKVCAVFEATAEKSIEQTKLLMGR